jgi:hypothetical protein
MLIIPEAVLLGSVYILWPSYLPGIIPAVRDSLAILEIDGNMNLKSFRHFSQVNAK